MKQQGDQHKQSRCGDVKGLLGHLPVWGQQGGGEVGGGGGGGGGSSHLSTICLLCRHVEVIHEDEASLTGRWPQDTLTPLVKPPFDLFLDSSSIGPSTQRDKDGHPGLLWQPLDHVLIDIG